MKLNFNFSPTCTGSLPFTDAKQACKKILAGFKEIPFWPQLPKRSYLENMYAQYSQGLPNIRIDEKKKTMHLDTSAGLTGGIEKAYERYLAGDVEYFAISGEYASGFGAFTEEIKKAPPSELRFVKGHVTGPVSFGLAVLDEKKQAIFYNSELQELLTKALCMKAAWQIRKLKEVCGDIIIFIDEPYMVSIGSSYVNIKAEDAVKRINEVIDAIHHEGAIAGIHCCGNTDWGLLLGTNIDIINFDAHDFVDSVCLYPEALKKFLGRDKSIAWGIVPTAADGKEDRDSLIGRLRRGFDNLEKKGIERNSFLGTSLITPSCGCGTLTEERTGEVLDLTLKISESLRRGK